MKATFISLATLLMVALSGLAFAAQDNVLTWDPPSTADLPNVEATDIQRKLEACTVTPDVRPWTDVDTVAVGTYTLTESNQPPGDYCYRAYFTNTDAGRGGVSNLAFKRVPFAVILNAPVLHPVQ